MAFPHSQDHVVQPGVWTLRVPLGAFEDFATKTGVLKSHGLILGEAEGMTLDGDAAVGTITIAPDVIKPSCTAQVSAFPVRYYEKAAMAIVAMKVAGCSGGGR